MTMRAYDSWRPEARVELCRGEGCGRTLDRGYMTDGVCPACSENQAACEHCGVVFDRAVLVRIDPHDLVCRECAGKAHRERLDRQAVGS